jgi:hypothetical protein
VKATILVRDLVKLIAKHGDLDVKMCVATDNHGEHEANSFSVDELRGATKKVTAFEIYGEEQ